MEISHTDRKLRPGDFLDPKYYMASFRRRFRKGPFNPDEPIMRFFGYTDAHHSCSRSMIPESFKKAQETMKDILSDDPSLKVTLVRHPECVLVS